MNRSFYLESLGCAKNQVESEFIIALLEGRGLAYAGDPESAGCLIVNTCGFIKSAKEESINSVIDFRGRFPDKKIILVGCLALRYQADLERELGEADGVWGNIHSPDFPDFVMGIVAPGVAMRKNDTKSAAGEDADQPLARTRLLSYPGSAYVKISEGCNNRCTYCAIPLIRGNLASRPRPEILREVRGFIGRGIREINLIAQDTSSFGTDRGASELPALLEEVAGLSGDFRVRLLYIHPDRFTARLLDAVRSSEKILPYFDLPFQHGSAAVLRAMNRRGDADTYLGIADRIRRAVERAVIRTTFLVGFPGETEENFEELLSFHERLRPQWAGMFVYSPEEGTSAFRLKPKVPAKTALARKAAIEEHQTRFTDEWLETLVGSEVDVLIEEKVEGEDLLLGRAWFQAPEVDGLVVIETGGRALGAPGETCRVRIDGRTGVDLRATPTGGRP